MPVLSIILSAVAAALLADHWLLGFGFYSALPEFAVPLAGFGGFLVALLWYLDAAARPAAKGRRLKPWAILLMVLALALCIAGCVLWLRRIV